MSTRKRINKTYRFNDIFNIYPTCVEVLKPVVYVDFGVIGKGNNLDLLFYKTVKILDESKKISFLLDP